MKKLIQDKNTILKDMLDGITVSNQDVEIVSDTIVVRKNKKQSGVALVSGGGSGHEPAHAGFVAQGMLDAAVCGEVFTSPTPDKILDAIKAVDNGDGVLLIIKNYAGDVMNFEMAQEMAQMEDIQVESVIVRDDIAISDPEKRRGVAGTVFVHKYAGYLAENGVALSEIKSKIEAILPEIKSIGMALTPPMVPTTGKNGFDIEDNEMEIGIGIHGEKGLHREAVQPDNTLVERLLDELFKEIDKQPLIVMVNGMGGTPLSELNIVTKYLDEQFKNNNIDVRHWFVGDYMTALDMQGFSITVLPFSEDVAKGLVAPTASKYF